MFEFLFKYSQLTFANGEILSASTIPVWALVAIVVVLSVLVGWSLYLRRTALSPIRLATVGVIQFSLIAVAVAMLWQPVLQIDTTRPGENRVVVLVDTSESMRYGEDGRSRIVQVADAFDDNLLEQIAEVAQLELATFDENLRSITSLEELPPPGPSTQLSKALTDTLNGARQSPLSAVVVVTDGSDNSGRANAEWLSSLREFGTPIHTIGVGREIIEEDSELTNVALNTISSPETQEVAQLTINSGTAQPAELKLYSGNNILASKTVDLRPGTSTYTLEFDSGERGVYDLEFVLEAGANEANQTNNRQQRILQVLENPRRILYLEGEPRWEYKFMRRALEQDSSLIISTLLRTSPNKFYRQGISEPDELEEGFPLDRETLFKYDGLILGSIEAALLSPEQLLHIKEFVSERGGSLLMLAGQRGLNQGGWGVTAVADVLPVTLTDPESETFVRAQISAQLTRAGSLSPILQLSSDPEENGQLWDEMPTLADFQIVGEPKPGAETLLEVSDAGATYPLLVTQRYGKGSATVLATSGTWRWQMNAPSDDLSHEQFWNRLLQSMVISSPQRLRLSTDQEQYRDTKEVLVQAELRDELFRPVTDADLTALAVSQNDDAVPVTLKPVEGQPGSYEGVLLADQTGDWRIDLSARDGETLISETSQYFKRSEGVSEHFAVAQNRSLLERIASETGGDYRTLSQVAELPEALRFSKSGIQERQFLPLWNMPALFLLLLLLKCLEWGLRLMWRRL